MKISDLINGYNLEEKTGLNGLIDFKTIKTDGAKSRKERTRLNTVICNIIDGRIKEIGGDVLTLYWLCNIYNGYASIERPNGDSAFIHNLTEEERGRLLKCRILIHILID